MTSEDNNEVLPEVPVEQEEPIERGPGHLLEKKREALGLSVQEAADALHITMHYVRALETDAHDKLPGDVFIKGYLRAYGNLLELDPTVLINVYNEYTNQRENADQASVNRRRRQRNRNTPWIVFSGIAFIGVAVGLWYFSSGSAPTSGSAVRTGSASTPRPASSAAVSAQTVSPGVPATLDQVATTREVPSAPESVQQIVVPFESRPVVETIDDALPPPDSLLDAVPQEGDSVQDATDMPDAEPMIKAEELPASPVVPEAFGDFSVPDTEAAEAPPVSAPVAENAAYASERLIRIDAGGEDVVQIRFSGESMVQVHDASEEQIYRDVRVAGDVLSIRGTAPFNILLGDASQSTLSLNGEDIDFSASIRIDNSARLTIGL